MSTVLLPPFFIDWHNPPNRPTLTHIILKGHAKTLCGASPKGKTRFEEFASKHLLCGGCVSIYDQRLYEDINKECWLANLTGRIPIHALHLISVRV